MNRSTRQTASKQNKLDNTTNTDILDVPSPTIPTKPFHSFNGETNSINDPAVVEFFPELVANNETTNFKSPISVDGIILPEPLPPLPPSLKVYNTRKRTFGSINPTTNTQNQNVINSSNPDSPPNTSSSNSTSKPSIIPGFVSKLYRMVDESTSNLIRWGHDGLTFVVTSPEDFSRQVLPLFFKHNNFSSFVRQLNMYGFHKVPHLQQGSMAASAIGNTELTVWEFSHVSFIRNRHDLLINVRRKIGKEEDSISTTAVSNISENRMSSEDFITTARSLRQELSFIYQQQNALRTDLQALQRDNQLLWNENLASRERHLQQQQVIDRILRFLASVFTTDGKLLASATSGLAGINSNGLSALSGNIQTGSESSSSSTRQVSRPLLLGNISGNEDELRRQVMELISGGQNTHIHNDKIGLVLDNNSHGSVYNNNHQFIPDNNVNFNNRLENLESTSADISKDISLVGDEISKVLNADLDGTDQDIANISSIINDSETSPAPIYDDLDFSSYLDCQ